MLAKQRCLEQVGQARQGKPGAAVPVAFWQHHPVADQHGERLADATCAFQARFDCDLVKITPASSFQLRDLGQTDSWTGDPIGRRTFGPGPVSPPEALSIAPAALTGRPGAERRPARAPAFRLSRADPRAGRAASKPERPCPLQEHCIR